MEKDEIAKSGLLPIKFDSPGYRALHLIPEKNLLMVESPFADKSSLSRLGGTWHKSSPKGWCWYFTIPNLNMLLDKIPFNDLDPRIQERAEEELKRIQQLDVVRKAALKDEQISLRIPGIRPPEGVSLYNYQKFGIQFGSMVERGFLLGDEMGLGKASTLDTKILTPDGWVEMGCIKVGDDVVGKDGRPQKVVAVHPHKNKQIYKVTFSDGLSTRCCEDHLWAVNTPTRKSRGLPNKVLSVKELIESGLERKNGKNGNRWNWYIPMVSPVDCFERHESLKDIPPYVMGALLGDGSIRTSRINLTSADDHVISRVSNELGSDWSVNKLKHAKYGYSISRHGSTKVNKIHYWLKKFELRGKYSYEKHIPEEYLISPLQDRIDLLQGLMDTDGTVSVCTRGNAAVYSTTSEKLRDGVVELCNSLGGVARVREKRPFYKDKNGNKKDGRLSWDITLSLPREISPFSVPRKANLYPNDRIKYSPSRAITSIEKDGVEDAQCITVSNEDSLYVTDHYIVTHNSLQAIGIALWRKKTHGAKRCLVVAPASLKYNWKEELEFWTDEDFTIIDGAPDKRDSLWDQDAFFTVVNPELIIRDYEEAAVLQSPFDMIIVDEIHMFKNWKSKRSKYAKRLKVVDGGIRIGLSGTPIDGRLEDLHSIFEFLIPGLFMTRGKFLDRYAIRNEWNAVVGYLNVDEVRETIKPFFLRRLKKEVAKQLPEKIFKNVYVELSTEERKIYNALKAQSHEITEEAQAITVVLRARQFCDAPGLLDEYPEFGSKYEACVELLEEIISNGHKVLIFSMFEQMVDRLYVAFEKNGWRGLKITGKTKKKDRPAIARQLNEDPNIDFCVMDEAGSTGLNFQGASYVLHYDDNWSPAIMKQRTDRAHRITTDHTVTVVNFICLNTIEDHVRATLKKKDSLSADAIGDDVNDVCAIKTLSGREAIKLL